MGKKSGSEREREKEGERDRCRLRSFVHAPIRALEVGTNVAGRVSRRRGQILHPRINIGGHGCTGRAARSDVNAHFSSRLHGCLWDGTQPSSHRRHSSCGLFLLFPCARAIVKFVSWPRTSGPARCPVASPRSSSSRFLRTFSILSILSTRFFSSFLQFVPFVSIEKENIERERKRESLECTVGRMDVKIKGGGFGSRENL